MHKGRLSAALCKLQDAPLAPQMADIWAKALALHPSASSAKATTASVEDALPA